MLLTLGISIALIIHSFDLRWSEEVGGIESPSNLGLLTLGISIALIIHSLDLFTRLILWSAESWCISRSIDISQDLYRSSIGFAIRSIDPLDSLSTRWIPGSLLQGVVRIRDFFIALDEDSSAYHQSWLTDRTLQMY